MIEFIIWLAMGGAIGWWARGREDKIKEVYGNIIKTAKKES